MKKRLMNFYMKRNINKENYGQIQNKYIERTWTFSAEEFAETPDSFHYWNRTDSLQRAAADTPTNEDPISVKTFLLQYSDDFPSGSSDKLDEFLIQREQIRIPPPGVEVETGKAYVLLNEAGSGKTTYLTWLAHELFQGHPTRWIAKLKLIECAFVFSKYEQHETIDETGALRLLFRLIYMNYLAPNINSKDIEYAKKEDNSAQKCAEALYVSEKGVELDATKIHYAIPCRMLVLLRIFRLKCERKLLYLLLDGFDEIAPTYKETALALLSWLGDFEGICKLYLTSRPYGFRREFEQVLKTCLFYRLDNFLDADILHYTHRFVADNWKHSTEEIRKAIVSVLYVLANCVLGGVGEIPLFLAIGLELLQTEVEKHVDFEAGQTSQGLMQECKNKFEPTRMMETFVQKKLHISNLEKTDASVGIYVAPVAIMMREKAYKKILRLHSILAMYVLFEEETVETLLPDDMRRKALKHMVKIQNGTEKSGIIEGVVSHKPLFIHRLFAEYFAALWLLSNKDHKGVKEFVKELMYGRRSSMKIEVSYFLNRLVCRNSPIHIAVLDRSNEKIEELLQTDKECVKGKDLWGRTPLHLALDENRQVTAARYCRALLKRLQLLLETTDETNIDATDEYFGWSALYYAGLGFFQTWFIDLEEQDKIFAYLHSEDAVEIFYCALKIEKELAPSLLYPIYHAKAIFQPLFKCIAWKLVNEKQFDLHASIKADTIRNERCKDLLELVEYYPTKCTPLEECLNLDSILLKLLVDAAGGPETVLASVAPHLLHIAFDRKAFVVLRYLLIECKFQLPSIGNYRHVLICLCLYMEAQMPMFRDLFDRYCKQYNIACLDEDQLRAPEVSDEGDHNTFDANRYVKYLIPWETPIENHALKNGIDEGTYFLLKMALGTADATIFKYIVRKTGIAVEIKLIAALLCDLDEFNESWSCASHFPIDMITDLHDELSNGQNLLHVACHKRWFALAECLIEHFNFDPFRANEWENNWNAFFYCVQVPGNDPMCVYLMEKYDMDWFGQLDSTGKSVFYYAIKTNWAFAMFIIEKVFDAELNDLNSEQLARLASLLKASGFNVADMFDLLENRCLFDALKLQTVCNALGITEDYVFCDEGRNLLHIACTMGWFNLVKCLIEQCNFDALRANERENNWNAFFYCVKPESSAAVFNYLLEQFDMDCFSRKDSKGKSVFHYALAEGDGQIACSIMCIEFSVRNLSSIPGRSACLLERLQEAEATEEEFSEKLGWLKRTAGPNVRSRVNVLQMRQILSYRTSS